MTNQTIKTALPVCLFVIAAAGCKDPADNVPAARVEAKAKPTKSATANPAGDKKSAARSLPLSAKNTQVGFVGSKVTGSHEGGFKSLSGELTLGTALTESRATITIDMTSVFTDSDKLTGHLRSKDFFDVEKYPTATFTITSVEAKPADGATHLLSGDLTLHGVTRSLQFPATLEAAKGGVTANAEFSINRKDFGIAYPGMKDDLIRDGVVIKLRVSAGSAP